MNQNQYTQKSMEAIQRAQALATEYGQQTLEQMHLLYALMEQQEGLIPQLLIKMNKDAGQIAAAAMQDIEKLPRVRGLSREQGKTYVSQEMDRALQEAAKAAERMRDEYLSVEHLFLGLMAAPDRAVKALFQRFDIRKRTSGRAQHRARRDARHRDNPEDTYEALQITAPI